MNPDYELKTVLEWMNEMYNGKLALTDFQRSHVWSDNLTKRFFFCCPKGSANRNHTPRGIGR